MTNKNTNVEKRLIWRISIFSIATIICAGLFVFGLIQNGNESVRRYNSLIAVDSAGGDVQTALDELRSYIYAHMNTEIGGPNGIYPPIQLKGTYERLVEKEKERVDAINASLYSEAQKYCEKNGSQGFSGRNRLDCIRSYVDKNGAEAQPIDDSFYKYDFVSPRWSPDLAGFSLIALIVCGLGLVYSIVMYFRTRHLVHSGN